MSELPECIGEVCITCSDTAVQVKVVRLLADQMAVVDPGAGEETVSVALVTAGVGAGTGRGLRARQPRLRNGTERAGRGGRRGGGAGRHPPDRRDRRGRGHRGKQQCGAQQR